MSTLAELGTYIDGDTALTLGTDLFLGTMPESPDACVALYESSPGLVTDTMTTDVPSIEGPRVQVLIRGARNTYATTRATTDTVWKSVSKIKNTTLSGVRWLRAEPVDTPVFMGRDESERPMFSMNFQITKAVS